MLIHPIQEVYGTSKMEHAFSKDFETSVVSVHNYFKEWGKNA
jgi:hypothetical protein